MKTDFFVLQICDFLDDGDGYYRLNEDLRSRVRPGWQYLLRLLVREHASDSSACASKALERFPANYALALQALSQFTRHISRYPLDGAT